MAPPSAPHLAAFRAAGEGDPDVGQDAANIPGVAVNVLVDDLIQLYVMFNELQMSHDSLSAQLRETSSA